MGKPLSKKRTILAQAQDWKCCWCGVKCKAESGHPNTITLEHLLPRSMGGDNKWENLAMSCYSCNHARDNTFKEEDLLLGQSLADARERQIARHRESRIEKLVRRVKKLNDKGWFRDGKPLDKKDWYVSIRIYHYAIEQRKKMLAALGLEEEPQDVR